MVNPLSPIPNSSIYDPIDDHRSGRFSAFMNINNINIVSHWDSRQYELIDFGQGRRVERFGKFTLERPCPAAERDWLTNDRPDVHYTFSGDRWRTITAPSAEEEAAGLDAGLASSGGWLFQTPFANVELRRTPFGHLGIFPEQLANWEWLSNRIDGRLENPGNDTEPLRALNLFAYTGAATLAMSRENVSVVHIDSSKPTVQWARENATRSGKQENTIRWIVEDARKFVSREMKRGNEYDLIVLDPPSFGHGPEGQRWEIKYDLIDLLRNAASLLSGRAIGMLWTGHTETLDIEGCIEESMATMKAHLAKSGSAEIGRSELVALDGSTLDCGYTVRLSF
jgi:23S rRNA (cytosine1962-C5)-methyltransferase